MSWYSDLKVILGAIEDLRRLNKQTERAFEILNDLDRRVMLLEEREARIIERAEHAAREAATRAGSSLTNDTIERIVRLEVDVAAHLTSSEPKRLGSNHGGIDD